MTNAIKDALRCADALECTGVKTPAAHLRRLVAENEAKDALLRQAVEALEWAGHRGALVATIRQHLEGRV